ncbi:MAG: protein-tyrosine-phosphatase [Verrucomicrobiae bacterium]|nr:protein-tyrosine-phosphatase [Verrucomicrobiae bacterium]
MNAMKTVAPLLLAWLALACSPDNAVRPGAHLLPELRDYVESLAGELDQVPPERRAVLDEVASDMLARLRAGHLADLTFICTHNSRRSHLSEIWAATAAYHHGLQRVRAFSGGTEVTACNCRTVTAMRRAGFEITDATSGDNPLYLVRYAADRPPVRAYSKLYHADANPREGFIALMTCSSADLSCPAVAGSVARHAMHYADPRLCDDLPTETQAYDERCREIAREIFYLMHTVRLHLAGPGAG